MQHWNPHTSVPCSTLCLPYTNPKPTGYQSNYTDLITIPSLEPTVQTSLSLPENDPNLHCDKSISSSQSWDPSSAALLHSKPFAVASLWLGRIKGLQEPHGRGMNYPPLKYSPVNGTASRPRASLWKIAASSAVRSAMSGIVAAWREAKASGGTAKDGAEIDALVNAHYHFYAVFVQYLA